MRPFLESDLFLLTLTVGLYCAGAYLYRRTRLALFHPVLLAFGGMIAFLALYGIDYARYREATGVLDFGLGLSVVSLGYLLYEQSEQMRGRLVPVLVSVIAGCLAGVMSVVYIARWLGADRLILNSIAAKSVTVPIALAVTEPLGGNTALTAVVVFIVGIFGSLAGVVILNLAGIRDPLARGFALGSAAHGIGTARAVELGAVEGALGGLAMALMGIATALLLPLIERFLY